MSSRISTSILLVIVVSLFAGPLYAQSIYKLITDGEIRRAQDSLSSISSASTRDGNTLFYASLLEPRADEAARLMEASLNASVSSMHREQIYFRLAHYYHLKGNKDRLRELLAEYRSMWESGKYTSEMAHLAILLDEQTRQYDAAIRQADRMLLNATDDPTKDRGRITRARLMKANGKVIASRDLLKEIAGKKKSPGRPEALYMLSLDAVERKRTDDAVFYYNLLHGTYPSAIGLDALIERMTESPAEDEVDETAAAITGTVYTVKVGVFSVKTNAERMKSLLNKHEKPVRIEKKQISSKTYHVVTVGEFASYREAADFKNLLEKEHRETFQVIAR